MGADQAQVPASVRSYSVEGDNGTLAAELPVLTAATWHEDAAVLRCLSPHAQAAATRTAARLGAEVALSSPLQWRLEVSAHGLVKPYPLFPRSSRTSCSLAAPPPY